MVRNPQTNTTDKHFSYSDPPHWQEPKSRRVEKGDVLIIKVVGGAVGSLQGLDHRSASMD